VSTVHTDNADTSLDLELAQIADRANLLREILLACERGGEFQHRTDLQTVFAPGLAMLADDISRAAMAAYDVAADLERLRRKLVPATTTDDA
jgi:hypothetical protein